MKLATYKGFEIHLPTSGGKAGFGLNKTGSIQVRRDGFIVKQFRFDARNALSRRDAMKKAQRWIESA